MRLLPGTGPTCWRFHVDVRRYKYPVRKGCTCCLPTFHEPLHWVCCFLCRRDLWLLTMTFWSLTLSCRCMVVPTPSGRVWTPQSRLSGNGRFGKLLFRCHLFLCLCQRWDYNSSWDSRVKVRVILKFNIFLYCEPGTVNCFSYYNTHKKFNYKPMLNVKYSCLRTREKHFHGNPTMGIFLNYRLQQQLVTRKRTVIAIAIEVHFYVYARLIYFSITCNF